jgi:rhomboid protease GluP
MTLAMPLCKNCGRELPVLPPGETTDLCEACLQSNLLPPASTRVEHVQPSRQVTQVILGLNVMVFLAMVMSGVSVMNPTTGQLRQFGANWGPFSLGDQPWRLLTANYVHVGLIHIALNMWCLWDIGTLAEFIFGSRTYAAIYTLCGLGGSIASVWWHPLVTGAGASGAIFGLAGVLIAAIYLGRLPFSKQALQQTLRSLFIFAVYNLFFGAVSRGVDNAAHIGGFVTGLAIGALLARQLHAPGDVRRRWTRAVIVAFTVFLLGAMLVVRRAGAQIVLFGKALDSMQSGQVDQAITQLERAHNEKSDDPGTLLLLANAYFDKGNFPKAEQALQKAVALKSDSFEARFNLGLTQMKLGKIDAAAANLQAAVALNPKSADAHEVLAECFRALGKTAEASAAQAQSEKLRKNAR